MPLEKCLFCHINMDFFHLSFFCAQFQALFLYPKSYLLAVQTQSLTGGSRGNVFFSFSPSFPPSFNFHFWLPFYLSSVVILHSKWMWWVLSDAIASLHYTTPFPSKLMANPISIRIAWVLFWKYKNTIENKWITLYPGLNGCTKWINYFSFK